MTRSEAREQAFILIFEKEDEFMWVLARNCLYNLSIECLTIESDCKILTIRRSRNCHSTTTSRTIRHITK